MIHRTRPYEMIVFDAGGTLIAADWQRVSDGLAEAAVTEGIRVSGADLMVSLRRVWQDVLEGRIEDRAHSREAVTHFWHGALTQALLLAAGDTPDDGADDHARAENVARAFYSVFDTGIYHCLIDGARETLTTLSDSGYRLGLLSNWSPNLPRLLERFAIHRFFEFVIVSSLVGLAKPDRAIFDLAAQMAGNQPDRLLYVGDSPANDYAASRAAGWAAVLIEGRRSPSQVAVTVDSLADLPAFLMAQQHD